MTRMVTCRRYKEALEGLDRPPLPGAKGQDIFDHVSKKAWLEWQSHQTMLINEKKLNMMNPAHREELQQAMEDFLFKGVDVKIDGYTPES